MNKRPSNPNGASKQCHELYSWYSLSKTMIHNSVGRYGVVLDARDDMETASSLFCGTSHFFRIGGFSGRFWWNSRTVSSALSITFVYGSQVSWSGYPAYRILYCSSPWRPVAGSSRLLLIRASSMASTTNSLSSASSEPMATAGSVLSMFGLVEEPSVRFSWRFSGLDPFDISIRMSTMSALPRSDV